MRWRRKREKARALEQARKETSESMARARQELATSRARLTNSREVADRLRRHNAANRYDTWLEQVLRGA